MSERSNRQNGLILAIGVVFIIIAVFVILFSLYLLPHLILKLRYDVPDWVTHSVLILTENWGLSNIQSALIIFSAIFFPGMIALLIASACSNKLSGSLNHQREEPESANSFRFKRDMYLTTSIIFKVILVIIAVITFVEIIEHILYSPPA